MKITICGSMVFTDQMIKIKKELEDFGHLVFISDFISSYTNQPEKKIEKLVLYHKNNKGAIKEFWEKIKQSDAILVLNYDRKGIANYIGGNTLIEIGFAYVLNKKIFLMNPIPKIEFYQSEIEATKPVIINSDLSKLN